MGKPAARVGDTTAHGGSIVVGCPTVLIGGMPAARVGDMHVCPMLNPGTPPPPHVGMPITMGSAGVLIGGMPAARVGDMAACAGPPDTIAMGCTTVLIGETGSGSASGGAGGSGGTASAHAGAATALFDNNETSTKIEHWVEIQFIDKAGNPVSGVAYKFTDPDGNESESTLRLDGTIRRDGLSSGQCKVQLFNVSNAKWDKDKAEVGEKVKMTADVDGYEAGTTAYFQIYRQDIKGPDVLIATIEAETLATKMEAEWEFTYADDIHEVDSDDNAMQAYSSPVYYFESVVESSSSRSGAVVCTDYTEIELMNEDDQPIANTDYLLYLSDGFVRRGQLDDNGYVKEENVLMTNWRVAFPGLSELGRTGILEVSREGTRSNAKGVKSDFIQIELRDPEGVPFRHEPFVLKLATGELISGKLDENGYAEVQRIASGDCEVRFPNIEKTG